jgi:hypothetical protein
MKLNQREACDPQTDETKSRKTWIKPTVDHLYAGAAENTPGDAIFDGPLETTGS